MKKEKGLIPVARDGKVIGKWFAKNIRYLKCRENLRPSDHAFVSGEWRLLFRATKGSFWRWVKPEIYETMFVEEMLKTDSYIKTFSQLAEAGSGSQKEKYLADKREYQELREFLLKMIMSQKTKWKTANSGKHLSFRGLGGSLKKTRIELRDKLRIANGMVMEKQRDADTAKS